MNEIGNQADITTIDVAIQLRQVVVQLQLVVEQLQQLPLLIRLTLLLTVQQQMQTQSRLLMLEQVV